MYFLSSTFAMSLSSSPRKHLQQPTIANSISSNIDKLKKKKTGSQQHVQQCVVAICIKYFFKIFIGDDCFSCWLHVLNKHFFVSYFLCCMLLLLFVLWPLFLWDSVFFSFFWQSGSLLTVWDFTFKSFQLLLSLLIATKDVNSKMLQQLLLQILLVSRLMLRFLLKIFFFYDFVLSVVQVAKRKWSVFHG